MAMELITGEKLAERRRAANPPGHTPGPWVYRIAGPNHWIHAEADDRCIAFIGGKDNPFTVHHGTPHASNAQLIAAAPDLLEACKAAVENCARALDAGDKGDWKSAEIFINNERGIAEAAIERAEG
jgi:hypothetical protein